MYDQGMAVLICFIMGLVAVTALIRIQEYCCLALSQQRSKWDGWWRRWREQQQQQRNQQGARAQQAREHAQEREERERARREQEQREQREEQYARDRAQERAREQRGGLGGTELPRPWWQVLGVSQRATFDDAKAAYRTKIKQYHPDRVVGLGEEFQQLADRKTKELNEAFNVARRRAST
jgi:DnaJ-domain-containing protein 1